MFSVHLRWIAAQNSKLEFILLQNRQNPQQIVEILGIT